MSCIDSRGGLSYTYTYRDGRTKTVKSGDDVVLESACLYGGGDLSEPIGARYSYSGYTDDYTQDKDDFGRVNSETTPLGDVEFTYDGLGRITERERYGMIERYEYLSNPSVSGYTTPLVNRITYADNSQLRYSYDANGNILRITDESGREIVSYVYDVINRLKRENIYGYKSVAYIYDVRGNITKKEEYAYTVGTLCESHKRKKYSYSYDGDRMVSFDGESCVYDENGNPETYRGQTMAWTRGRMLYRYGNKEFYYDATGRRLKKTAPGGYNAIEYLYAGDKLIAEKENGAVTKRYFYDGMGIAGMEYGANKYYFRKNLQGDVTEIYDESANQVGSYVYDAWGKILSKQGEMAEINPFRYRGYYYDAETDLYYLQSRYYDPETGRFLNSDAYSYLSPETLNGLNLYAYCGNNPVMYVDSVGTSPKWWQAILIGIGIIAVAALVATAIVYTGGGAAAFFVTAGKAALGGLKIAAVAGLTAGSVRAGSTAIGGGSIGDVGKSFVTGFADGFFSGSIYAASTMLLSAGAFRISGLFNNGYGASSGAWQFGYQTPNTPGITIFTFAGGINGGSSVRFDLDMYNGLHLHYKLAEKVNNKFFKKVLGGMKRHRWMLAPILIGMGVGLSDPWSEW